MGSHTQPRCGAEFTDGVGVRSGISAQSDGATFAAAVVGELGLIAFGLGWWWTGCRHHTPVAVRRPSGAFVAWWCVLILAAYWASWQAEVPYRGDESFHLISVQIRG